MNRVSGPRVIGLNLTIKSFQLSKNLYKPNDDIRVSITTLPEERKQSAVIPARQMGYANTVFMVNITIPDQTIGDDFISNCTDKIIVVFRKKSFFKGDPMIGSLIITSDSFPQPPDSNSMPIRKRFPIYEPISNRESKDMKFDQRPVVGQMDAVIRYLEPSMENDPDEGNYLIDYLPNCGPVDDIIKDENYKEESQRCYYFNRPYHYEALRS